MPTALCECERVELRQLVNFSEDVPSLFGTKVSSFVVMEGDVAEDSLSVRYLYHLRKKPLGLVNNGDPRG